MNWLEQTIREWKDIGQGVKRVMTTEIRSPEVGTALIVLPILYIGLESSFVLQGKPTLASRTVDYMVQMEKELEKVPNYQ